MSLAWTNASADAASSGPAATTARCISRSVCGGGDEEEDDEEDGGLASERPPPPLARSIERGRCRARPTTERRRGATYASPPWPIANANAPTKRSIVMLRLALVHMYRLLCLSIVLHVKSRWFNNNLGASTPRAHPPAYTNKYPGNLGGDTESFLHVKNLPKLKWGDWITGQALLFFKSSKSIILTGN